MDNTNDVIYDGGSKQGMKERKNVNEWLGRR